MTAKSKRRTEQIRAGVGASGGAAQCVDRAQEPYYDVASAAKLAVGAGALAGCFAYVVNGQDLLRSCVFAWLTLAAAWYAGKTIFPKQERREGASTNEHGQPHSREEIRPDPEAPKT